MNKKISLALSLLSFALLQACGGGGGGSDTAAPPAAGGTGSTDVPGTGSNTGSVSAPFVGSASARYQLTYANSQLISGLKTSVQAAGGAITALDANVLSGNMVVKEISGDAHYAMGRWTAGAVTTITGATMLTGTDSGSYHYVAFNAPTSFPASVDLTCDAGTFTAPTPNSSAAVSGSASGSATLSFAANVATVNGTINVAAAGGSSAVTFSGAIQTPAGSIVNAKYLSNGAGAYTQIGDAGAGAYLIVSNYAATLADGSRYIGVAKFRCA